MRVPVELQERRQWVLWRYERVNDRDTKVPYQALRTERHASSTDPSTWSSFAEAEAALAAGAAGGVGFVFSADDPFCGVDLDRCRDPATGLVEGWAALAINRLDSYTETSPSGCGFHVVVRGCPPACGKRGQVEMYDRGRYFTITGELLDGALETLEHRQSQLEALYREHIARPQRREADRPTLRAVAEDDQELVERARAARNGEAFARLWGGDASAYGSRSEADMALCSHLAFWTGADPERVDRLFRSSGLMRDKWDARRGEQTYGQRTVDAALEGGVLCPPGLRLAPHIEPRL